MRVKVYKDVRNNANRRTNFETANIDKTVNAAVKQIQNIEYIFEKKGRDFLSPKLQEVAVLRLENPEMSLREIGESLSWKATRSGVNHCFVQITKIAEGLREQEIGEGGEF